MNHMLAGQMGTDCAPGPTHSGRLLLIAGWGCRTNMRRQMCASHRSRQAVAESPTCAGKWVHLMGSDKLVQRGQHVLAGPCKSGVDASLALGARTSQGKHLLWANVHLALADTDLMPRGTHAHTHTCTNTRMCMHVPVPEPQAHPKVQRMRSLPMMLDTSLQHHAGLQAQAQEEGRAQPSRHVAHPRELAGSLSWLRWAGLQTEGEQCAHAAALRGQDLSSCCAQLWQACPICGTQHVGFSALTSPAGTCTPQQPAAGRAQPECGEAHVVLAIVSCRGREECCSSGGGGGGEAAWGCLGTGMYVHLSCKRSDRGGCRIKENGGRGGGAEAASSMGDSCFRGHGSSAMSSIARGHMSSMLTGDA